MAFYNLHRIVDGKVFTAMRTDDEQALFYFSILTSEQLTFEGAGPAPYVLGQRVFLGAVDAKTPVYRKSVA